MKNKKYKKIILIVFLVSFLADLAGIYFKLSFSLELHIFFVFVCFIDASYSFFNTIRKTK